MGKLNEIQEQVTQSFGNNSFTTKITDTTVEFDSARDSFTFKDEVSVPSMKINGTESQPFTTEEKTKLSQVTTPMNIKGRVDSASELPTEDVQVGDVYLVGESGNETFEEYVCTEISGSPEQPVWENLGHVKSQPDWNQNNSNAEDFIKNRTHYVETGFATLMEDTFTDPYVEGIVYAFDTLTSDFEMEEGKTYRITMLGQEYVLEAIETEVVPIPRVVYGDIEENPENPTPGSFLISATNNGVAIAVASETEITSIDIKIEGMEETVHQLDEKFIPDTIARVTDIPEQAFNIDKTKYNIYPTFTNPSNTVDTRNSIILTSPSTSNNSFGGDSNVSIVGAASSNTISGGKNIAILTSPSTTVGGNNNTVISSLGGSQSMGNSENGSIILGGGGGISISGGGYQKVAINAGYGTSITGSHSTVISSSAVIGASNSTVLGVASGGVRTITAGDSHMILGGDGSPKTISNGSNNSIIGSGSSSIENGSTNLILGCSSASITGSSTYTCAIISASGNSKIQGGAGNMIIGGASSAPVTIPSTVAGCIVIGGATAAPTESNTVYVPALNAVNGVKTKKMTIAGIDPADCFMHSEIIDASSDISFSRTIASASSSKTDGYVEILYKVSSGVTCSAYINSADVALTADGDWHKLGRGCNPADGVEIHINNPSPVADATMEVISKVYYI